MFLASIDPVDLVDKAAGASDRWLFLACVVFIILAAIYIIRSQQAAEKVRVGAEDKRANEHNNFMLTIYTESVKLTAQVLVCLQDNNSALKENKQTLDRLNDRLDREDNYRATPHPLPAAH